MGRLAAGIAHEISTPIRFVGDKLRFLTEAFDDLIRVLTAYRSGDPMAAAAAEEHADIDFVMAEIPDSFARTLDGIGRVAGIARAIKAFSHPGDNEKAPVDLNEAVHNALTIASSGHLGDLSPYGAPG